MASPLGLLLASLLAVCAALSSVHGITSTSGRGVLVAVGGKGVAETEAEVVDDVADDVQLLQGRASSRPGGGAARPEGSMGSGPSANADAAAAAVEETPEARLQRLLAARRGSGLHNRAASRMQEPSATPTGAVIAPAAADVMRVNSAAPHTSTMEVVANRVALVVVMALPLVIFLALKAHDRREDATRPEQAALRKLGDTYRQTPEDGLRIEQGGFSPASIYGTAFDDMYGEGSFMRNVLSGVGTSLVCIPQAISFSFVLGVSPLNGIWAGAVLGMYATLVGGRPGMISCAAAATAVVLQEVSQDPALGIGPMAVAVGICGALQLLVGLLRLSRFVSLVPHTVMLGFMNGIAILITLGQLTLFRERSTGEWVEPAMFQGMMYTCLVAMCSAVIFKRVPVVGDYLPAPIVAVAGASVYCYLMRDVFPMRDLEEVAGAGTFAGGWSALPALNFPAAEVRWDERAMWSRCAAIGAQMALIGLVESLLTITVIDQITETRGSPQREVYAQGLGNLACAAFGLQGGCTVVGQSLLNVSSGGRSRVSGVTCAVCLVLSVVVFGPAVGRMPVAALAGIMFLVGGNTFCWGIFRLLHRMDLADVAVVVLVTVLAVVADLASAVVAGVLLSGVAFAWRAAQDAKLEEVATADGHEIRLHGPLFFASAMSYQRQIQVELVNEKIVILDFSRGQVLDHSAMDAVARTCDRFADRGKQVMRQGLPLEVEEALCLMTKAPVATREVSLSAPAAALQPADAGY